MPVYKRSMLKENKATHFKWTITRYKEIDSPFKQKTKRSRYARALHASMFKNWDEVEGF